MSDLVVAPFNSITSGATNKRRLLLIKKKNDGSKNLKK